MVDLVQKIVSIGAPFNMIVLILLIGSVVGLLSTIAIQIRRYGCHRQDIELKRELVDRGLSAEEIERIVQARAPEQAEVEGES
jgi:hypothetical protein